ncbi:MAG TPA: sigma 54-interacting transcriptional regulator [Gemmatimonadales bacterium]|nr:sigma 54-interacting transcriptional regulator [Gemmatimonadales bacterium]
MATTPDRRNFSDRRSGKERRAILRLGVIQFSEAFQSFWADLGTDLALVVDALPPPANYIPRRDTVAVILAAGGAEEAAIYWLESQRVPPTVPLLVAGSDPSRRTAMRFIAAGARDYFALPDDLEILRGAMMTAAGEGLARWRTGMLTDFDPFSRIVGRSDALKETVDKARRLLPHRNASALIVGETGTGKELLARAMHDGGPRRDAPFVAINCSALPEHLIESELFGHERGAFTDAHAAKPGLFEVADGGTLFLDEVADLPLALQAKLLRTLEDKKIRRVGGTRELSVDVRIFAATTERFAERVEEGSFREDLYFRISTVVLRLPPLRERGDDLVIVAEALLESLSGEHGLSRPALTPEVITRLQAHEWPGNIRELKNALERALLLAPAGELTPEELLPPVTIRRTHNGHGTGVLPFPAPLRAIARAAASAMVERCDGNRGEAARRLVISTSRLRRLLNETPNVESGASGAPSAE